MRKLCSMLLALTVIAGMASVLSACNTTAGAGQDISAAGNAVTDTAQDTKHNM